MNGDRQGWQSVMLRFVVGVATVVCSACVTGIWSRFGELVDAMNAVTKAQAVMQSQVSDVRNALVGVYLKREADREHAIIYRTDQDQYQRIAALEKQVASIQARQ